MSVIRDSILKKYIQEYKLQEPDKLQVYLKDNPQNLLLDSLSRLAELANNSRVDTAAYYTDKDTLKHIYESLPIINKSEIRILEPSVGVGNFLSIIIDKYSYAEKLIIDVNDIDSNSLEIARILNKYRDIPKNVEINFFNYDFLSPLFSNHYDISIGNPPFLKLNKSHGIDDYRKQFSDHVTKNIAGFFIQKLVNISDYVSIILPKYFLNNPDFSLSRERIQKFRIDKIIDFGEKGFKGVLIETIGIFINTTLLPDKTVCLSVTNNIENYQLQSKITSDEFPYWLLYRNNFFDTVAKRMTFSVFKVFRDRQITNNLLSNSGDIRVLKSRNIKRDGSGVIDIAGYDSYISTLDAQKLNVWKYYHNDDVFLSPNMTYYPRVIRKPKGMLVNGSVAILENVSDNIVLDKHLKFLSSQTFEDFYRIARNYSTRSLNIDSNSVYFFGLYE